MGYTGDDSGCIDKLNEIDSRCIVKFRPADNWGGEYGFDWFREGDHAEKPCKSRMKSNSNWVENIMNNNDERFPYSIYGLLGKVKTDYKTENLVGKYGAVIDIESSRGRKNEFRTDFYVDIKEIFGFYRNTRYIFKQQQNNKYVAKKSSDQRYELAYNQTTVEFDYDVNSKTMKSPYCAIPVQFKYFLNDQTIEQGDHNLIDPDLQDYINNEGFPIYIKDLGIPDPNLVSNQANLINADQYARDEYCPIEIKTPLLTQIYNAVTSKQQEKSKQQKKYYVPSINLFYEKENINNDPNWKEWVAKNWGGWTRTIKLLIHAENILKIDFFIDAGTKGVQLNPRTILGDIDGELEKELTITLTKDFPINADDISIRAIATHKKGVFEKEFTKSLAGKINIVKYEPKYIDIIIVPVNVQIAQSVNLATNYFNIEDEKIHIKELLSQALIIPRFETVYMSDSITTAILNDYKSNDPSRIDTDITVNNENIVLRLLREFDDTNGDKTTKIKLFFLPVKNCRSSIGLAYVGGKAAIILPDSDYPNTACHELTHCLGLNHSFSNDSKYTFKQYETSNIMDYQYFYNPELLTFWRWQWEEMRNGVDMHNEPPQNIV